MNRGSLKAIDIQFYTLFFSLASIVISLILTYNQKLIKEDKKTLLSDKASYNLSLFNRVLILVLSFVFLYVNVKLFNLSKKEGEDLKSYILQIIASVLAVISGLIALYVVGLSTTENIVDVENPVI